VFEDALSDSVVSRLLVIKTWSLVEDEGVESRFADQVDESQLVVEISSPGSFGVTGNETHAAEASAIDFKYFAVEQVSVSIVGHGCEFAGSVECVVVSRNSHRPGKTRAEGFPDFGNVAATASFARLKSAEQVAGENGSAPIERRDQTQSAEFFEELGDSDAEQARHSVGAWNEAL